MKLRNYYRPGAIVWNSSFVYHELVLKFAHCIPCEEFPSGWYVLVRKVTASGLVKDITPYAHCHIPVFRDYAGTLGRIRGAS